MRAFLAALMLTIAIVGCGPTVAVEGRWVGERKLATAPDSDPAVVKSLEMIDLRIDGHQHFTLFEHGLPKTGQVTISNGKALLWVEEIADRPKPKDAVDGPPIELTPQGNGVLLYHDPAMAEENIKLHLKSDKP